MGGPFPGESGLYSIHIQSPNRRAVKGYLDLSHIWDPGLNKKEKMSLDLWLLVSNEKWPNV